VFPKITSRIARSEEGFFLFSLAWVFLLTAIVSSPWIGFSKEIGGFLAGLALANSAENFQILSRMKALRDFFLTIFFVMLGLEMKFASFTSLIIPTVIFALFALTLKPIIIMVITSLLGYRKRTSFLVGISMAQVSEFSFIILFLGNTLGDVPSELVTEILVVGVITFVVSTYFIQKSYWLYLKLHRYIGVLEKGNVKREHSLTTHDSFEDMKNHIVLIGGHQMGQSIVHALKETDEQVLIVDFDPDVVAHLKEKGQPSFFGDIADTEIQERAGIERAKLVVSTVPDVEDNLILIQALNHVNKKAKIIVMAYESEDAKELYKAGADYVILPHLVGGHHLAKMLVDKNHLELIEKYKAKDMNFLA
jgi:voltage-gated potassium channel Kch